MERVEEGREVLGRGAGVGLEWGEEEMAAAAGATKERVARRCGERRGASGSGVGPVRDRDSGSRCSEEGEWAHKSENGSD